MTLENDLYKKHLIDKKKLIKYGFKQIGKNLIFKINLAKDDFQAVIEFDGKISGKIYDLSTNEEYTNFRIESSSGFSSEIREEYINLLTDIRDKCTENQLFQTKQAQKISKYIINKYNDEPEFLWKNFPTYAVFRNKKNNKWYALFGTVAKNKVDINSNSTEIVEIINLKINKNDLKNQLNTKGIYEAYHMNKKNWVTIIFDETLKDSEIESLVDKSYNNI